MTKPKPKVVVAIKHGKVGARAVTYQREMVLCGKSDCGKLHGPYWYAYWRCAQRNLFGPRRGCKRYIGKDFRPLTMAAAHKAEAPKPRRRRSSPKGAKRHAA